MVSSFKHLRYIFVYFVTGYHDRSAYPQPSFYNPIPWHAPSVPSTIDKADKTKRAKAKPYKWNPDKYF